jgi:hypothetical protein
MSVDVEKASALLRKARLEAKEPTLSEVFKLLTEMAHELSIARSEIALLTLRVEELESK